MKKFVRILAPILKILLALVMMLGGIQTMLAPVQPLDGALGFLFENRPTIVAFGILFFSTGFFLLMGKILRKRKWVGRSLLAIYLICVFTVALEWAATGTIGYTLDNIFFAILSGALYLYWKHKAYWLTAKDVAKLRKQTEELRKDS